MRRTGLLLCLLLLAAGCGGGQRRSATLPRLPGSLAHSWANRADAVARAEASGDSCLASRLADSLQSDVTERQARVPLRYRTVLLQAVDRLASGITCTVTTVVTVPAQPPHRPPGHGPRPGPPHHPGHGHHGPGGDGG